MTNIAHLGQLCISDNMILLFVIDYGNTIYIYDILLVSPMSNFTQHNPNSLDPSEKKQTFTLRTNYFTLRTNYYTVSKLL